MILNTFDRIENKNLPVCFLIFDFKGIKSLFIHLFVKPDLNVSATCADKCCMMTVAHAAGRPESTVGSVAQRRLRVNENNKQLTVVEKSAKIQM